MNYLASFVLLAALGIAGCASIKVAREVQAGRNALQSGHPEEALAYLVQAAQTDPTYELPYRIPESVLTYLGRAYYETGQYEQARRVLEKAISRFENDQLARVYLGLTLMRGGDEQQGRREIETGLRGIHSDLDYIAADTMSGFFWDPARSIRSGIEKAVMPETSDAVLIASAEQIAREFDEEIDKARRDEGRFRAGRGDGGGS